MHSKEVILTLFFAIFCLINSINARIKQQQVPVCNDNVEEVVRLRIYTSKDVVETIEILKCNSQSLNLDKYCKADSKVKLITHGFAETWRMQNRWDWVDEMKNEMFKLKDISQLCVIAVDWKELAAGGTIVPNYWKAISNMNIAGELVANVLNNSKINVKNVHCIGFSLGVHMCSMMYKIYYDKFRIRPGRLTGLDPAGPLFADKSESEKINFNDADFVDVIHTSENFGLPQEFGHMDFFTNNEISDDKTCHDIKYRYDLYDQVILYQDEANGNKYEEVVLSDKEINENGGISSFTLTSLFKKIKNLFNSLLNLIRKLPKRVFVSGHQFFGCSHLMAVRHFIFSINECIYESQYCETTKKSCKLTNAVNFPRMGYHADKSDVKYRTSFSNFYVNTSHEVPFCYDLQKTASKTNKKSLKLKHN